VEDFGSFVLFKTGFAIHEASSLERTIWREHPPETNPTDAEICCCTLSMRTSRRPSKTSRHTWS
jgi:hypothetical protein